MNMPGYQPTVLRAGDHMLANGLTQGLSLQGCDILRCAQAVMRCAQNPDPVRCILEIAPNCRDCLP
jgi:hypothetical protein